MFGWFKTSKSQLPLPVVDIHSHLLPGLDDGAKTMDDAIQMIKAFRELGYRKLITTPHVMSDVYANTIEKITTALQMLRLQVSEQKLEIVIDAAAEYYLDEQLLSDIRTGAPLLTIGPKYLLFETNFLNEPFNLKEFIFLASAKGYKPVLAHPERYLYIQQDINIARDLANRGVQFQINMTSLTGHYSKPAQTLAHSLIEEGLVHWLGSDCHHMAHIALLKQVSKNKYLQKALTLPLLNNTIE